MAKTIQVRIAALSNYFAGKDSIIDVVLAALENFDLLIFLRTRSERLKANIINEVSDMWDKAAVLAQGDVYDTKRTIKIVFDDIEHARTCLGLGGCTLYGKLSYHWKLFRMNRQKLPLIDFLALHIAEHGNRPEEKEEMMMQLEQNIVTADDMTFKVEASLIRKMVSQQDSHLHSFPVDSLTQLCTQFKELKYTPEQLVDAWEVMLEKKVRKVDCSNWHGLLCPADALLVLFEKLSYKEVKVFEIIYLDYIV